MEQTANRPTKGKKTSWLVGGALVAILAVVYFSFFYPPTSGDEAAGTIGAAKKYRSEQITEHDVQLAGQEAVSGSAAATADVQAFDRMPVAEKVALANKQALEARLALFARFSQEHASAILDRTAPEGLKAALERMSPAERQNFFALLPALDRSQLALRTEASDLNAAYAALDVSAKTALAGRLTATQFEKLPVAERLRKLDAMAPAERYAMLKSMPVEATASLAERVAPDALMKPFLKMPAADQRQILARVPMDGRMMVYATLPVEAKTLAFAKLPVDQQTAAFERLPVESKQALYRTLPAEQRTALENKTAPAENKTAPAPAE